MVSPILSVHKVIVSDYNPILPMNGTKEERQLPSLRKVMNREECPLKDCQIISSIFDYDGGELLIEEHAIKVTVPFRAIEYNCMVQIEAAASLFGPFITPEGYSIISAYVWIGACYEFKKNLKVEMEHDIVVSEETDTSELLVLTACEEDMCNGVDNQIVYKMHEDTCEYHYELNMSTCTILTSRFCTKCLSARGKTKKAKRVIMYHYLPEDYRSAYEFITEVSFCYDLKFCKERTEERYAKRRMDQQSSNFVCIFDWKKDKVLLSYPDKLESWEVCHIGDDEIIVEAMNFRKWYESLADLRRDEENDLFPPRFKLKMINKDYNLSALNLVYKYMICMKSKKREDKHFTLNISGFGLNKASISQQKSIVMDQSALTSSEQRPEKYYTTTTPNQEPLYQANILEPQSTSQSSQHQLKPACSYQQPLVHHSALTNSHQQLKQCSATTTLSSQQQSQALALQQSASPRNQQQLQSVLQSPSQITNITTYNIVTTGDSMTLSLDGHDSPPSDKGNFNSLHAFATDITNMVNVNEILPKMIERKLITSGQQQDLTNPMHTTATKQEKFCTIILGLPEDCVKQFLYCLMETSYDYEPHKQLYDKLCG